MLNSVKSAAMENNNKYCTIFVVDDSDVYRSVLIQAIESENETFGSNVRYNIHGFASGEECMEHAHLKPDIMIMDYLLDGNGYLNNMNGMDLLKQIKMKVPKLDVIVLSCQNNVKVAKDFMREGIREYIQKDSLGQYKVQQVLGEFIRKWEKRDRRKNQLIEAVVISGIILLVAAIIFSLA
jgi:DNA-binding NarL/FixJ family response regulator